MPPWEGTARVRQPMRRGCHEKPCSPRVPSRGVYLLSGEKEVKVRFLPELQSTAAAPRGCARSSPCPHSTAHPMLDERPPKALSSLSYPMVPRLLGTGVFLR